MGKTEEVSWGRGKKGCLVKWVLITASEAYGMEDRHDNGSGVDSCEGRKTLRIS